jgi:uncharacterized protein YeeX (DUF496 family)
MKTINDVVEVIENTISLNTVAIDCCDNEDKIHDSFIQNETLRGILEFIKEDEEHN